MTLDFGTTLAGRITDNGYPYAKTVGSFAGLAGAISDSLVRHSGLVPERNGSVLDIPHSGARRELKLKATGSLRLKSTSESNVSRKQTQDLVQSLSMVNPQKRLESY